MQSVIICEGSSSKAFGKVGVVAVDYCWSGYAGSTFGDGFASKAVVNAFLQSSY